MILCDYEIRNLSDPELVRLRNAKCDGLSLAKVMIEPFSEAVSGNGVISYGLSHAGYDLRLGPEVLVFKNTSGETVNPKKFGDDDYRKRMFEEIRYGKEENGRWIMNNVTLPAHSYVLGRSLEYLRIPNNLKGRCVGKSTLARSGIIINTTPLEPGWEGHLTIEIGNITPCPALVFVGEGIAQLEFETLSGEPQSTYAGKKYQGQTGVTPARVL